MIARRLRAHGPRAKYMGRTERSHTHRVPPDPPDATTDPYACESRNAIGVQHTGGAPPQLLGASLHRISRFGGSLSARTKCSALPDTTGKHSTEQQGHLKSRATFRAKVCQAAGIKADRKEAGAETRARAQKCRDRRRARAHHHWFKSLAAVALTGVIAVAQRMVTCARSRTCRCPDGRLCTWWRWKYPRH